MKSLLCVFCLLTIININLKKKRRSSKSFRWICARDMSKSKTRKRYIFIWTDDVRAQFSNLVSFRFFFNEWIIGFGYDNNDYIYIRYNQPMIRQRCLFVCYIRLESLKQRLTDQNRQASGRDYNFFFGFGFDFNHRTSRRRRVDVHSTLCICCTSSIIREFCFFL